MEKVSHFYASAVRGRKNVFHNSVHNPAWWDISLVMRFHIWSEPVRERYWFERRAIRNHCTTLAQFFPSFLHKKILLHTHTHTHKAIFHARIHKAGGVERGEWGGVRWDKAKEKRNFLSFRDDARFYYKKIRKMVVAFRLTFCGGYFCNYLKFCKFNFDPSKH